MEKKHFLITYYKNMDSGIHIQKINNSLPAQSPHSHEYFQIYYVLKGSLTHIVNNNTFTLNKGDVFIIPPKCTHNICQPKDALFYTFSFTADSLRENYKSPFLIAQFLQGLEKNYDTPLKISIKNHTLWIENILENLHKEFEEKQIGYVDAIISYATNFLIILARDQFEKVSFSIPKLSNRLQILSCIEFIDAHFSEPLTLNDMAKWSAMSKSEFCRQFLAVSGTTFQKYLHSARIKHATKLIKKDYNISSIYCLCGYNDFSTFYRNFKKIMGCSPMQYLKNSQ